MAIVEQYNRGVRSWTGKIKRKLLLEIVRMTTQYSGDSRKLKASARAYQGEVSRIQFAYPYYLVFVHKGAGRGYGGSKTGLFSRAKRGKDGSVRWSKGVTNRQSMGKMGTGARRAKPWFNPVIETNFPALADLIANYHGDKVVANIQKILVR